MDKTFDYETLSTRCYKAFTDDYSVLVVRDGDELECYLKKREASGSTPYMFMYGVPKDQDPIREVLDTAMVNADNYAFLFEDEHWMRPCSVPVFHPGCMLHECSDCGSVVEGWHNYCPECGHKLAWESEHHEE